MDTRHADDFSTLLRCAEAETAVGSDAGDAQRRIDAARAAAADDRFQQSLVDLLDAELSIRRSEFDQARGMLEKVVRMNETEASLRGRAQWLIGETHYLQQDFADAIEAYRRVEGIDPGGMWVSAALVQAGKSFEQLGRTREAAVCYGNLLNRFADTAHAELRGVDWPPFRPMQVPPFALLKHLYDDDLNESPPTNGQTVPSRAVSRRHHRGVGIADCSAVDLDDRIVVVVVNARPGDGAINPASSQRYSGRAMPSHTSSQLRTTPPRPSRRFRRPTPTANRPPTGARARRPIPGIVAATGHRR